MSWTRTVKRDRVKIVGRAVGGQSLTDRSSKLADRHALYRARVILCSLGGNSCTGCTYAKTCNGLYQAMEKLEEEK